MAGKTLNTLQEYIFDSYELLKGMEMVDKVAI